jgi:5,10-methylenetetrahydrofolate reductase
MQVRTRCNLGKKRRPTEPPEHKLTYSGEMLAAGADFIQTQPAYGIEKFKRWIKPGA